MFNIILNIVRCLLFKQTSLLIYPNPDSVRKQHALNLSCDTLKSETYYDSFNSVICLRSLTTHYAYSTEGTFLQEFLVFLKQMLQNHYKIFKKCLLCTICVVIFCRRLWYCTTNVCEEDCFTRITSTKSFHEITVFLICLLYLTISVYLN